MNGRVEIFPDESIVLHVLDEILLGHVTYTKYQHLTFLTRKMFFPHSPVFLIFIFMALYILNILNSATIFLLKISNIIDVKDPNLMKSN